MGKLSPLQVKNAKQGRHSDGQGLYLLVGPTGCKSWVLRVQVDGQRRDYGLGSFDLVSLAEAREKAVEWRKAAKAGINPSHEAKRHRALQTSFEEVARAYFQDRKSSWKNPKHAGQWINTLEAYAFPTLGRLSVDRIDATDIHQVLLPIWQSKPETARRVRQRIGSVLDYAKAKGLRQFEAPVRAVNTLLKGIKQPKAQNFAAMPYKDIPAFLASLQTTGETIGKLALQFVILTAARSGEVRRATWSEVDFTKRLWSVPAAHMKMGETHIVPLSESAIALLKKAKPYSSDGLDALLFPGLRRQPLSDMTLAKVLHANGGAAYTVHGFRSAFRDWAAENGYNNDWAEAALAHSVSNRVEAAYRRTNFLEQRIGLMADWAEFCVGSAG